MKELVFPSYPDVVPAKLASDFNFLQSAIKDSYFYLLHHLGVQNDGQWYLISGGAIDQDNNMAAAVFYRDKQLFYFAGVELNAVEADNYFVLEQDVDNSIERLSDLSNTFIIHDIKLLKHYTTDQGGVSFQLNGWIDVRENKIEKIELSTAGGKTVDAYFCKSGSVVTVRIDGDSIPEDNGKNVLEDSTPYSGIPQKYIPSNYQDQVAYYGFDQGMVVGAVGVGYGNLYFFYSQANPTGNLSSHSDFSITYQL